MKRSLIAFLTWVVAIAAMLVAGTAFGQPKPKPAGTGTAQPAGKTLGTVKVTITKNFGAKIEAGDRCILAGSGQPIPKFVSGPDDTHAGWDLQSLFIEGAKCAGTDVTPTVELTDNAVYPYPVQPREYQWLYSRWTWVESAVAALGVPECEAAEAGAQGTNTCKALRVGDGYVFKLGTPFDKGEITVKYKPDKGAPKMKIPVYPCEFDASGPLPGVVAGASEQLLEIRQSGSSVSCWLPPGEGTLTDSAGTHPTSIRIAATSRATPTMTLTDVPSDLGLGMQSFNLKMGTGFVAIVRAAVIPAITVGKLSVRYQVPEVLDMYRQFESASGEAFASASGKRSAVVSRSISYENANMDAVVNLASLDLSPLVPSTIIDCSAKQAYERDLEEIDKTKKDIEDKTQERDRARQEWQDLRASAAQTLAQSRGTSGAAAAGSSTASTTGSSTASTTGSASASADLHDIAARAAVILAEPSLKNDPLDAEISALSRRRSELVSKQLSYFAWKVDRRGEAALDVLVAESASVCPRADESKSSPSHSGQGAPADKRIGPSHDLHQIPFVVHQPMAGAVNVALLLEQTVKLAYQEKAPTVRTVLKVVLPLADNARRESIPLPARDILEVRCSSGKVGFWNGEVHAISEGAVIGGECQIQLRDPPEEGSSHERQTQWKQLKSILPLYGPQTLNVIVRRGGVEWKQIWKFAPIDLEVAQKGKWLRAVVIQEPHADSKTDAYYTVEVRPTATQNIDVEYRNSTLASINETSLAIPSELMFSTRLRTRGAFALPCVLSGGERDANGIYKQAYSLRTYLSATVLASGLRFPASNVDLKSSTSSKLAQYVSPVVGALWSWEPWDYDMGANPLALNPVFQFGAHFYTLGNDDIGFNPLVGLALSLPLVKENTPTGSQLGTQATIGAFFEWDTRENSAHGLLGLSVNVGSLLSGK